MKPSARTVLVLCPHKSVLKFLVSVLEREGFIVFGVENMDEGFHLCETLKLDLIITELGLDHKSGIEVAKCIRQRMGGRFGVIYLSGVAHPEIEKVMREVDAKHSWFLKKPFGVPELMGVVSKALKAT